MSINTLEHSEVKILSDTQKTFSGDLKSEYTNIPWEESVNYLRGHPKSAEWRKRVIDSEEREAMNQQANLFKKHAEKILDDSEEVLVIVGDGEWRSIEQLLKAKTNWWKNPINKDILILDKDFNLAAATARRLESENYTTWSIDPAKRDFKDINAKFVLSHFTSKEWFDSSRPLNVNYLNFLNSGMSPDLETAQRVKKRLDRDEKDQFWRFRYTSTNFFKHEDDAKNQLQPERHYKWDASAAFSKEWLKSLWVPSNIVDRATFYRDRDKENSRVELWVIRNNDYNSDTIKFAKWQKTRTHRSRRTTPETQKELFKTANLKPVWESLMQEDVFCQVYESHAREDSIKRNKQKILETFLRGLSVWWVIALTIRLYLSPLVRRETINYSNAFISWTQVSFNPNAIKTVSLEWDLLGIWSDNIDIDAWEFTIEGDNIQSVLESLKITCSSEYVRGFKLRKRTNKWHEWVSNVTFDPISKTYSKHDTDISWYWPWTYLLTYKLNTWRVHHDLYFKVKEILEAEDQRDDQLTYISEYTNRYSHNFFKEFVVESEISIAWQRSSGKDVHFDNNTALSWMLHIRIKKIQEEIRLQGNKEVDK